MTSPVCNWAQRFVLGRNTTDAISIDREGDWVVKQFRTLGTCRQWHAAEWREQLRLRYEISRLRPPRGVRINRWWHFDGRTLAAVMRYVRGRYATTAQVLHARECLAAGGWGFVDDITAPNLIDAEAGLTIIDFRVYRSLVFNAFPHLNILSP